MSVEAMKLQEIMSQAQVFASAWSLVGGRFDGGKAMDEAEVAKNELHQMVAEALAAQPQQEPVAGCVCRWNSEGDRVVTCERHQGWLEVIAEWADRAREAEKKLKFLMNTSPPAQPQPEPVAWIWKYANGEEEVVFVPPRHVDATHVDAPSTITPLYTSPPARKPLTDEEIETVWRIVQANDFHDCVKPFARAIEAKHNIKENT